MRVWERLGGAIEGLSRRVPGALSREPICSSTIDIRSIEGLYIHEATDRYSPTYTLVALIAGSRIAAVAEAVRDPKRALSAKAFLDRHLGLVEM